MGGIPKHENIYTKNKKMNDQLDHLRDNYHQSQHNQNSYKSKSPTRQRPHHAHHQNQGENYNSHA